MNWKQYCLEIFLEEGIFALQLWWLQNKMTVLWGLTNSTKQPNGTYFICGENL